MKKKELTKKIYKLETEKSELQKSAVKTREAFDFIFTDKGSPYRVEFTTYGGMCSYGYGVQFKYVDEDGVLHEFTRSADTNNISVLSADRNGAVICYKKTVPYSYYYLNKKEETFAEIPSKYFCDCSVED